MPTRTKTALAPGQTPVELLVDAADVRGRISPLVYGANHRYPYNGFHMWDPARSEPYPLFVRRFEYTGITAVRYPGGRTANNYHWKRAIGPVDQRRGHVDTAFGRQQIHGKPLSNEFGPDEFGEFLETVGATGSVVANFATGNAAEAAAWVEYMNTPLGRNPNGGRAWARVRADNGHPRPYGIKYWEIGNELAGEKTFWLGPNASDQDRATKYAFGGSTRFIKQPVGTATDFSASASLSTGAPHQTFYVPFPPISRESETVFVGDDVWSRVADLESAGEANVYEVDPARGRIRFGDGEHGNVPPRGSRVSVSYLSGPHDGFTDYYREMKSVDPDIRVGSALNSPLFTATMGSEHPYDFLVAHSYSFFRSTPQDDDDLHDLMMQLTDEQASKVAAVKSHIRAGAGSLAAKDIDVVISEWAMATGSNIGLGRIDAPLRYAQSLDGALYVALLLQHWIKLDIPLAEKHSLIDIDPSSPPPGYAKLRSAYQALIGPNPCFIMTAPGYAFRMFSSIMRGKEVMSRVVNNPSRPTFTGERLTSLVPLAAVAGDGGLSLIVVNRDRDEAVTATVRTRHFDEDERAIVWTLDGPDYLAVNTVENPHRVRIRQTNLQGVDEGFRYRFPAHSVTAISLR